MAFNLSSLSSSSSDSPTRMPSGSHHRDEDEDGSHSSPSDIEIRFPFQLHDMLNDAQIRNFEDIVSWSPSETEGISVFKVHDKTKFEESILPVYFNTTKHKSFQRQLNLYMFSRHYKKGNYWHPYFVQGQRHLCQFIKRAYRKKRTKTGYAAIRAGDGTLSATGGTEMAGRSSTSLTTSDSSRATPASASGDSPMPQLVLLDAALDVISRPENKYRTTTVHKSVLATSAVGSSCATRRAGNKTSVHQTSSTSTGCTFDEQSGGTPGGHHLGGATNVSSQELYDEELSKIGSQHPQKREEKGWLQKHSTSLLEYGYLIVATRTTSKEQLQPWKRECEPEDAIIKEIIRTFRPAHRSSTLRDT